MDEPEFQSSLSEREREVLFLAADGLTDKEIAIRLQIGPKTVRTYWDRMRAKFGAASRTEVLAKALQQAYDQIAQSEERLRTFVQHMPVLFNAFDDNKNIILVNEECSSVTGYDRDTLLSPEVYDLAIPDAEERASFFANLSEESGDYRDLEVELTTADGSKRVIAWSSRAREVPIPGWASWAIGVDITDRRKAQRALELSEANYRSLLETSGQGVWVIDTQYQTVFANQRLADMFGCSVEDIKNSDEAFFHDNQSRQVMLELIATGPVTGSRTRFTYKFRRKDGNDLWAHVDVSPLLDFDGNLYAHAALLTDVSRAKALERSNAQLRHVYQTLLETTETPYVRLDRSMSCVESRLPSDLELRLDGLACDELLEHLNPQSAWSAGFRSVFTSGETTSFPAKFKDKPYDVTLVAEPTPQQSIGYVLAILKPTS